MAQVIAGIVTFAPVFILLGFTLNEVRKELK